MPMPLLPRFKVASHLLAYGAATTLPKTNVRAVVGPEPKTKLNAITTTVKRGGTTVQRGGRRGRPEGGCGGIWA